MASSNGNIFPPPGDFAIRVTATAAAVGGGSAVAIAGAVAVAVAGAGAGAGAGGGQGQQDRIITTRRKIPLKWILRDGNNVPSFEKLKNSLKRFYGESFRLTYSDPLDGEMIDLSEDDELLYAIEQFSSTGTVLNLNLSITAQQQQQQQQHLNNNNNDIIIQAASPTGDGGTGYRNRDHQQQQSPCGLVSTTTNNETAFPDHNGPHIAAQGSTRRSRQVPGTEMEEASDSSNTSDNASAGEEPKHPHFTKKKKPTIDRESPNEKAADAPTRKRGICEVLVGTSSRSRKSTRKKAKKKRSEKCCRECGWRASEKPDWHPKGKFAICICPDIEEHHRSDRMKRDSDGKLVLLRSEIRRKNEKEEKKRKKEKDGKKKDGDRK